MGVESSDGAAVPAAPEMMGRFQVIGKLGEGAQSVVYLAYDPQLQREVALKALRLEPNDSRRAALLREARAVSRMSHPGIVPVFEALDSESALCLVFEYVAGQTLAERIAAQGPMQSAQAVAMLLPVLQGVAYAHAQRIVHRDLKPSNILLDDAGRARVMDFGIAVRQNAQGAEVSNAYGSMLGTPAYMAPEFARDGEVSPAMDIFGAGLVLYEMLCGRRAVGVQQGVAAIRYLLRNDICLPDLMPTPVDEGLRAIVNQALSRDPIARQASMDELVGQLQQCLNPARRTPSAAEEMARSAALDTLLARMPAELEFAVPGKAAQAACALIGGAGDRRGALAELVRVVLDNPPQTLLLLRLANSAQARAFGATPASTLTKAISELGVLGVAQALQTQSQMSEGEADAATARLQAQYMRARDAGLLAQELSGLLEQDAEEARIAGMLRSLGRIALAAGLPLESATLLDESADGRTDQEQFVRKSLGIGLADLGLALAKAWGLPAVLLQSMTAAQAGEAALPATRGELLGAVAALADELVAAQSLPDESAREPAIASALQSHGQGLCLSRHEVNKAMARVGLAPVASPKR